MYILCVTIKLHDKKGGKTCTQNDRTVSVNLQTVEIILNRRKVLVVSMQLNQLQKESQKKNSGLNKI